LTKSPVLSLFNVRENKNILFIFAMFQNIT